MQSRPNRPPALIADRERGPATVGQPNRSRWWFIPAGIALIALVAAAFGPAIGNEFVDLDDEDAFLKNEAFRGLTPSHLRWALTTFHMGSFRPLGWVLYEAQHAIFGLEPSGYHLVSVILHAANAVGVAALAAVLIARCRRESSGGADGRGLAWGCAVAAAAIFAIHPLRVEAVAWTSSQPFLPAAGFGLASVFAYLRSVDAGGGRRRFAWLMTSIALFAASLAFHAVLLGLPFVLLLLDIAPLRRFERPDTKFWRLAAEKLPFVALSFGFGILAIGARKVDGALSTLEAVSISDRIALACHSAAFYPAKTVWPTGLRICYAPPEVFTWSDPKLLVSAGFVAALSVVAFALCRSRPALAVAWASYWIILLPNSGLISNTPVLAADRYGYMPLIVPTILLAAAIERAIRASWSGPARLAAGVATLAILVVLAAATREQCRTWRDSPSIWAHALAHEPRANSFLHCKLGRALANQGRSAEAEAQYRLALNVTPYDPVAHDKLGLLLIARGRVDEAEARFVEAVRLEPKYLEGRMNLGFILVQRGRFAEAEAQFAEVIRLRSDFVDARTNLGALLGQQSRFAEAETQFAEVARLRPGSAEAWMNLGYALIQQNKVTEARRAYAGAVALNPNEVGARHNLAVTLAQLGRRDEAAAQYNEALRIDPGHAESRRALAELMGSRVDPFAAIRR